MRRLKRIVPITFMLVLSATGLWAQAPVPGGGGNEAAPLDGFSTALLLAGAAYGIKRYKAQEKEQE